MKKNISFWFMILVLGSTLTSCYRSRCEMWEDTKTCGRYFKKGIGSLFGQHIDSREYAYYYQNWDEGSTVQADAEYIPLKGSAPYQQMSMQEFAPISKESPGDPGSKIPGIEGFTSPSGKLATLLHNVHFDTDNYTVKGTENLTSLRELAHYLNGHPNTYIFVEGHADERGAAAYNLALGSRRANSVRSFLIQNGVNPDQLFTISYGVERPLVSGHDESAWKQNRRAQFKVYDR